jgi:hypothetical protein
VKIPAVPGDYDPDGQITESISDYFTSTSDPKNSDSIFYLLARRDPYVKLDAGKRAIGTVMHLIQDSFARGHTRRVLLNPEDLTSNTATTMTFKPGTYGEFGDIVTFHSYDGQDDDMHEAFDEDTSSGTLDPTKLYTFNGIVGGRDAIDRCKSLLTYYAARNRWEEGPRQLLQTIFNLSDQATAADTSVNLMPIEVLFNTGQGQQTGATDPHFKLWVNGQPLFPAYVVARNSGWVAPGPNAAWISPRTDSLGQENKVFNYRVTFVLPSDAVASTTIIKGRLAGDNQVREVYLNNVKVPAPFGPGNPGPGMTEFGKLIVQGNAFVPGSNTLEFRVQNHSGPTGLLVIFDSVVAALNE